MSKNPKPLKILVASCYAETPWVAELKAKGHEVYHKAMFETFDHYDLILAPQACRWLPGMEFCLDELIKGARKIKYPDRKPGIRSGNPEGLADSAGI